MVSFFGCNQLIVKEVIAKPVWITPLTGLDYCCIVLVGLSPYAIDGRAFSPELRKNKG